MHYRNWSFLLALFCCTNSAMQSKSPKESAQAFRLESYWQNDCSRFMLKDFFFFYFARWVLHVWWCLTFHSHNQHPLNLSISFSFIVLNSGKLLKNLVGARCAFQGKICYCYHSLECSLTSKPTFVQHWSLPRMFCYWGRDLFIGRRGWEWQGAKLRNAPNLKMASKQSQSHAPIGWPWRQ